MKDCRILGVLLALAVSATAAAQTEGEGEAPAEGEAAPTTEASAEPEAEEAPEQPAIAEDRLTEARGRLATGEQLFEDGNYDAALVEFQEALEILSTHPMRFLVIYNIGKSYEQLFRYDQAMRAYESFLQEGGAETELAAEVRAKVDLLTGLLGTIKLSVNVPEYEVWVDDRMVGTSVESVLVPGGSHVVEIRATGHVASQQEVQLPARQERELSFVLEELAEEFEGLHSGFFWASTGVAVASLGVGVIFAIIALGKHQDLKGLEDEAFNGLGRIDDAAVDDMVATARNADIMFGIAGVFAITAITFALFTDWGGDDDEEAPESDAEAEASLQLRVAPAAGPSFGGLVLGGTF